MVSNDFIYSFLLSVQFIANCSDPTNQNKTVGEIKKELEEKAKGSILNPSLFLGMAYMIFVLAKETKVLNFKFAQEIEKQFKIVKWEKDKGDDKLGNSAIVRRIRNAISHGKISYSNEEKKFIFYDGIEDIIFEAEITFENFKDILFKLIEMWHKQNQ